MKSFENLEVLALKMKNLSIFIRFSMFLKFARSMISIFYKAFNSQSFHGLQNATTILEMLQIPANMKSTNDETLNMLLVL